MVEKELPGLPVDTAKDASVPPAPATRTARDRTTTSRASRSSLLIRTAVPPRPCSRNRLRGGLPACTAPGSAPRLPGEGGSGGEPLDGVVVHHLHAEPVG